MRIFRDRGETMLRPSCTAWVLGFVIAAGCGKSPPPSLSSGSASGGAGADPGAAGDGGSSSSSGAGDGAGVGSGSAGAVDAGSGTASGTPTMYTLTVDMNGPGGANGRVDSRPGGITCGSSCTAQFADGTDIELMGTPGQNSFFGAWEGGFCSGTSRTCRLRLTKDAHVTAVFQF